MLHMQHQKKKKSVYAGWLCRVCLILLTVTFFTGRAGASDLDIFLTRCGNCHKTGGEAAPVNPADKAGLVWKKYFQRNRHAIDLSSTITELELERILAFLEHHAADSDHPVAAIIPK